MLLKFFIILWSLIVFIKLILLSVHLQSEVLSIMATTNCSTFQGHTTSRYHLKGMPSRTVIAVSCHRCMPLSIRLSDHYWYYSLPAHLYVVMLTLPYMLTRTTLVQLKEGECVNRGNYPGNSSISSTVSLTHSPSQKTLPPSFVSKLLRNIFYS